MSIWYMICCEWMDSTSRTLKNRIICCFRREKDAKEFLNNLREARVVMYDDYGHAFETGPVMKHRYYMTEIVV